MMIPFWASCSASPLLLLGRQFRLLRIAERFLEVLPVDLEHAGVLAAKSRVARKTVFILVAVFALADAEFSGAARALEAFAASGARLYSCSWAYVRVGLASAVRSEKQLDRSLPAARVRSTPFCPGRCRILSGLAS